MIRSAPLGGGDGAGRRAIAAVLVAVAVVAIAGCQAISALEFTAMGQAVSGFGSEVPDACASMPAASFTAMRHGSATIDFSRGPQQHVVLDDVQGGFMAPDQGFQCGIGTQATFTSSDGTWSLDVIVLSASGGVPTRVAISYDGPDTSFYVPDDCAVSDLDASASGISGQATCTGAHWLSDNDATPAPSSSFAGVFDATIRFEARP